MTKSLAPMDEAVRDTNSQDSLMPVLKIIKEIGGWAAIAAAIAAVAWWFIQFYVTRSTTPGTIIMSHKGVLE